MTLIVAWAALDKKGQEYDVSAMYILSESRISWGEGNIWDNGRKIFHFQNHPDILGYCGDVLFTTQVLSQIITLGDAGLLFKHEETFSIKSQIIFNQISALLLNYPESKLFPSFSIIHCGKTVKGTFECKLFNWEKGGAFSTKVLSVSNFADRIIALGSGATEFERFYFDRYKSYERKSSREIYQLFIDTLSNIKDTKCGGPPQLAGVYRGDIAKTFGIIIDNKRYVLGMEIMERTDFGKIEWRNELFERCSPITNQILPNAQRQPKLK
jgi:hypothetical protein